MMMVVMMMIMITYLPTYLPTYLQVESPFRLMDEYDVFMDEARRNKTLETLQQYSMRATLRSKQFIIITPNNINSVKTNKNGNTNLVKIHKMPNPKRANLSAHGLQQQTIATI